MVLLRLGAPHGVFNVDVQQVKVSIAKSTDSQPIYLSTQGNEFGNVKTDCKYIMIELNLMKVLSLSELKEFYLNIEPNVHPEAKQISLNQWIDVSYPSSYQLANDLNSSFTLSFPNQFPVCSAVVLNPKFYLTPGPNNVKTKDIDISQTKSNLVVLTSLIYYEENNLLKSASSFKFSYQTLKMKDIQGNDVIVDPKSLTCGSTMGLGFNPGTIITSVTPKYENSAIVCSESVFADNSLIIIYGQSISAPDGKIKTLSDGLEYSATVAIDRPSYSLATIGEGSCVIFEGQVTFSSLTIYMLQQKLNVQNPTIPTETRYTDKRVLQTDYNSVKFCSENSVFNGIGGEEQQMVFFFTPTNREEVDGFVFHSYIEPAWKLPLIIGVSIVLSIVLIGIVGAVLVIVYFRRKKRVAYADLH